MGVYQRTIERLATTKGLRWVQSKALTPLDLKLRNSRFAPSRFGVDVPLCFLTTTGRKSGEPRTVPLLYVSVDTSQDAVAVVASNFGTEHHPGWAYNLEAEPRASLDIENDQRDVLAQAATPDEAQQI